MQVFINFSNHPSAQWSAAQLAAARRYGESADIAFPRISPAADSAQIDELVEKYLTVLSGYDCGAIMLQGESVFTYRMVCRLKERVYIVPSACSDRKTIEYVDPDGKTQRLSEFEFVQFREY